MTQLTLDWLKASETARHNQAVEGEENRSNLARETETHRSNVANEGELKRSHIAQETETRRSNIARESENYRSNVARETETQRSNLAREAEDKRSNIAKESETNRSNEANEFIKAADNYLEYVPIGAREVFATALLTALVGTELSETEAGKALAAKVAEIQKEPDPVKRKAAQAVQDLNLRKNATGTLHGGIGYDF